ETGSTAEGAPTAIVTYGAANGKTRTKSIKDTSRFPSVQHVLERALGFLLGEGFILRGPQQGAIRWLTWTEEKFRHGHPFGIARSTGLVSVGDTGVLRSIRPGDCEQKEYPIGAEVMPRAVGCGDEHAFA